MYSKTSMKQRVLLTGPDAIDLLHRISTVNTHTLNLNEKISALFLNPQGKILCFFQITLKSETAAEIEFDENFLEVLDQYTFSEKYSIENLPSNSDSSENEKARIESLIPHSGAEFKNNGETNPLEVNLRSAVHDNKGCYPGQEVIEKIISLGSPAKKLCLLSGSTTEALPTPLFDEASGNEIGTLTSASNGAALAIIKRTHLKENLSVKTKESTFTIQKVS